MTLFTPIAKLEFSPPELITEIPKTPPTPEMTALGKKFRSQILSAYLPKSSVHFINDKIGYGLFVEEEVAQGSFVCEYMGIVRKNDRRNQLHDYLYKYPVIDEIGRNYVIDAENKSTLARFINHSYEPNLIQAYAYVDGLFHAIFIAAHTIEPGAQFCYSYGEAYWNLRGPPSKLHKKEDFTVKERG